MRKQLLPRKSASAIQMKLQTCKQNERTVADFGKEISELFADLTITQSDGNSDHYNVLRPLNENYAIKRFADGLRNRRTSTIIAARDFNTLKDAIQAAQDEEITIISSADVMGMSAQPRGFTPPHRAAKARGGHRGYARGQSAVKQEANQFIMLTRS
ncbi:uncharacterized protein LOC113230683 [Hyposmocoma kahamanoa]|uniref:uncharacterized protein LOC113228536 n=1 Tax=Hyposmocoma kahamanoa TaxID=1477025 RepID=UPI000E6D6BF9|nr:uncharacterized protein LOC113228536 [Hyposmocoma kahamanoa]XP_026320509.1 uncharacterized protein LOC113230683 [Hyposmocoma kahamanoa]